MLAALLAFSLIMSIGVTHTVQPLHLAFVSRGWPSVSATVVKSAIVGHCAKTGGYTNSLLYSFEVDGHSFHGQRETFGIRFCGAESEAQERAGRYLEGSLLTIYYDPRDPNESVVFPGKLSVEDYLGPLFIIPLLAFTVIAVWRDYRENA